MSLKRSCFRRLLFVYFIFLFVFVAIKFNGSVYELQNRIDISILDRKNGVFHYNLIPLHSISIQIKRLNQWWALKNFLGNITIYIPFCILLPIAFSEMQKFYKTIFITVTAIITIEFFQLITCLGTFDIDDIILNSIGGIIGYIVFFLLKKRFEIQLLL